MGNVWLPVHSDEAKGPIGAPSSNTMLYFSTSLPECLVLLGLYFSTSLPGCLVLLGLYFSTSLPECLVLLGLTCLNCYIVTYTEKML